MAYFEIPFMASSFWTRAVFLAWRSDDVDAVDVSEAMVVLRKNQLNQVIDDSIISQATTQPPTTPNH